MGDELLKRHAKSRQGEGVTRRSLSARPPALDRRSFTRPLSHVGSAFRGMMLSEVIQPRAQVAFSDDDRITSGPTSTPHCPR